jgi:hypothetical protein
MTISRRRLDRRPDENSQTYFRDKTLHRQIGRVRDTASLPLARNNSLDLRLRHWVASASSQGSRRTLARASLDDPEGRHEARVPAAPRPHMAELHRSSAVVPSGWLVVIRVAQRGSAENLQMPQRWARVFQALQPKTTPLDSHRRVSAFVSEAMANGLARLGLIARRPKHQPSGRRISSCRSQIVQFGGCAVNVRWMFQ